MLQYVMLAPHQSADSKSPQYSQPWHPDDPDAEKAPLPQLVQLADPAPLYVPAGHAVHSMPSLEYLPEGHETQEPAMLPA